MESFNGYELRVEITRRERQRERQENFPIKIDVSVMKIECDVVRNILSSYVLSENETK